MLLDGSGFQIFLGDKREPGESMKAERGDETATHMNNFLDAVKSRKFEDLRGDVAEGAASAVLVHLANTSLPPGPQAEVRSGDADRSSAMNEANAMKTRNPYRAPYIVA